MGKISYWAGVEEGDDRIFVPDLGAVCSMHDRWLFTVPLFRY
jgi:hypothetical protein